MSFVKKFIEERVKRQAYRIERGIFPESLMFFVTDKCNLRCPHCFFWRQIQNAPEDLNKEEMAKVIDSLPKLSSVALTGGEPTLRADLYDIVEMLYGKTRDITITTNGILTDTILGIVKKITGNMPRLRLSLQISIDGTKEVHESIRGSNTFDNLIKTIKGLRQIKSVNIVTVTTLSQKNKDNVVELVKMLSQYQVDVRFNIIRSAQQSVFGLSKDLLNKEHAPREDILLSPKDLNGIYLKLTEANKKYKFWSKHNELLLFYTIKIIAEQKKYFKCYAGKYEAVIYPNGDVSFCEFYLPFANLKNYGYDFRKLWLDDKVSSHIKNINNCFCVHSCNLATSISFDPELAYLIFKSQPFKLIAESILRRIK